jgi:hypothetical protein
MINLVIGLPGMDLQRNLLSKTIIKEHRDITILNEMMKDPVLLLKIIYHYLKYIYTL